jgi:Lon protease-like protein
MTPPSLLEGLLVFPLPDVHLFPHALLPLHVFEPRYRALARDCLATTRLLAMATLEPGYESDYEGRPPVKAVCGLGEVVQSHPYPDGRYDLLVRGVARVRIVEELPPQRPYRVVNAARLDDVGGSAAGLASGHRALVALCDRLAAVLPSGGETLRALARQEKETGAACDVLAAALVTEPADRQVLLEQLDVSGRLDRLAGIVAALVGRFHTVGSSTN